MRKHLTDEQLQRILAALREPRRVQPATLQAASDSDVELWKIPELRLTVKRRQLSQSQTRFCFTGDELWCDALVQCEWSLYDDTQPSDDILETVHIFFKMPSKDYSGQYMREVDIPKRLQSCPAVARIVPKYADPEIFVTRWQSALVKPSLEELRQWIKTHLNDFPPRHRETWRNIPDKLAAES